MDRNTAMEELQRLLYRHQNGPHWSGYADIQGEAVTVVCDLLADLGCADVAERFREVLALPVEED